MRRRPGESIQQMNLRLNKTCVWCGHRFKSVPATNAHEDTCRNDPRRKPK